MRCKACDSKMSGWDMARTMPSTGEPVDLCGRCWGHIKEFIYYGHDTPTPFFDPFTPEQDKEEIEYDICKDEVTVSTLPQQ